jgi:DNA-binding response OmpR family regulator
VITESDESNAQPTVLVIDDEDYVADMIASVLALEGYAVSVAYNGRDGLQEAKAFRGEVIIVDIMMPYMSGLELVEHIRAMPDHKTVGIVLISAGARPREQIENTVFLPKPFDIEVLLDTVATMAERGD